MDWDNAKVAIASTKAPRGYELGLLRRQDVPELVGQLAAWYPDLEVSSESIHLAPSFYYDHTVLADVAEDRAVLPVVALHDDRVVALITFEKNASRAMTCRIGVIAPAHRGAALASLGPMLLEKLGRAVGAELVYYFATLTSAHQQVLAERFRYQLVGIVPAMDRSVVGPGQVKRVYEAIYAKVLVGEEAIAEPPPDALTYRTRAVWTALFRSK
jgi:hypothetical protein